MLPGKALDLCRALHAEENAIVQVAHLGGVSLDNATLYTTTFPCQLCAKKIAAAGIRKVVWLEPYPHAEAQRILREAGIKFPQFEGVKARGFPRLFARSWSD
jgi:dCMP deaminase